MRNKLRGQARALRAQPRVLYSHPDSKDLTISLLPILPLSSVINPRDFESVSHFATCNKRLESNLSSYPHYYHTRKNHRPTLPFRSLFRSAENARFFFLGVSGGCRDGTTGKGRGVTGLVWPALGRDCVWVNAVWLRLN